MYAGLDNPKYGTQVTYSRVENISLIYNYNKLFYKLDFCMNDFCKYAGLDNPKHG